MQQLRETGHMTKGRAEVMRYGICKCLQFLITGLQFSGSFSQLSVERTNLLFPPVALGDVIVRFQDRSGPLLLVSPQRPSARHDHRGTAGFGVLRRPAPSLPPA